MNTELAHSRRWWALIAVALATSVTTLDNTVVNALPSIQRDLGLSMAGVEWIISGYLVAFASFMLVGGRLSDAALAVLRIPGTDFIGDALREFPAGGLAEHL